MGDFLMKFLGIFIVSALMCFKLTDAICDRSVRMLAAEDICWTRKVKIADRIQFTTKSVLNFAKDKLGIGKEESYHPQQCDYYECVFGELKMLNGNGYPNYDKIVEWIDNNIIYNPAKTLYQRLNLCHSGLAKSVETNSYFYGDLTNSSTAEVPDLQGSCEILKEYMQCLAMEETDLINCCSHDSGLKAVVSLLPAPEMEGPLKKLATHANKTLGSNSN